MYLENKIASNEKTKADLGWIIAIYMAMKPVYLFSSGALQPCDFFIMLASIYVLLRYKGKIRLSSKAYGIIFVLLFVLLYQSIVNLTWSLILHTNIMKATIYYLFNYWIFCTVVMISESVPYEKLKKEIRYGCLLSLIVSLIGVVWGNYGTRATGFFNNPNQLGYYAIIIMSYILLLRAERFNWIDYCCLFISSWLIVISGSKAAFISGAILILSQFVLYHKVTTTKKAILRVLSFMFVVCLLYIILFSENDLFASNTRLMMMRRRILFAANESDSNLAKGRGYNRVIEMGINFLWGMGEGAYDRFETLSGLEIHSSFVSFFVSYGLIGSLGLMLFMFRIIKRKTIAVSNIICSIGIILYGITHNGMRNTLMWVFFAIMLIRNIQLDNMEIENNYYETEIL